MAKIYSIVKKNSAKHQTAVKTDGKAAVVALGGQHVMVPSERQVSAGHYVSHAKNRTPHRRLPNVRVIHLLVDGVRKAIRLPASEVRTFKKLTAPKAE
jgi:ribosomal protein L28